ncbi:hypothetical protein EKJ_20270 [Qipengyuania flava]|uniref:Acyltransferase n=2 Tax=Qipengyuania flava TaxID=192812 RepID=A0A3T1CJQ9_9SPHN|nr:hypothetical protein EKJ_20270 [Qipengyuania flava]
MLRSFGRAFGGIMGIALFVFFGGDVAARWRGVQIGKRCRIYTRNFGSEPFLISIGDDTTITSGVKILTHDGGTSLVFNEEGFRYQRFAPVSIGDSVFVGVNAIIMPGVRVGSNAIVAAGAVVTRDVADGTIVAGTPARVIGSVDDYAKRVRATCPNSRELQGYDNYREYVEEALAISEKKRRSANVVGRRDDVPGCEAE